MAIGVQANGASISPDPRVARDYSQPVQFTITAPDGTKVVYNVTVKGAECLTPAAPPVTPPVVPPVVPTACTAAAIGSTGYSLVFKGCSAANVAEYYDKTECVRDNATGLIWQGHTLTGLRSTSNSYSNYDSTSVLQKWNGATMVAPTQIEIDAATNSIGFKNAVNATNLCGSNNWRLPSYTELLTIVKPGTATTGNTEPYNYDREWFPNSNADYSNIDGDAYWTSTADSIDPAKAWFVAFNGWGRGWALGRSYNESWAGAYGNANVRLVK